MQWELKPWVWMRLLKNMCNERRKPRCAPRKHGYLRHEPWKMRQQVKCRRPWKDKSKIKEKGTTECKKKTFQKRAANPVRFCQEVKNVPLLWLLKSGDDGPIQPGTLSVHLQTCEDCRGWGGQGPFWTKWEKVYLWVLIGMCALPIVCSKRPC